MRIFFVAMLLAYCPFGILAQCNVGSYTVSGNQSISSSCIINGDLIVPQGASLNVDYSGPGADTFVVQGNILLQGNGALWVHSSPGVNNDQFIVSNNFSNHRSITCQDSSRIVLEHIEFKTQEDDLSNAASIYMSLFAEDNSTFFIDKAWLERSTAWLLCELQDNSSLIGIEPNGVPTEMYLQDASQASLRGANTEVGVWMNFESITDTLDLPPVPNQPFTWKVGRGVGGLNTPWFLELDTVDIAPGVQIFPSSQIHINGAGIPGEKELSVSLLYANSTDTIKDLDVGMQNGTVPVGSTGYVTFNQVGLGPIAWQIYALMNENLFIKNSIINEIGIAGPSSVTVDSSLLQLAVLASIGAGGSSMTINNSEIWNQSITAGNNSNISLSNCHVYGSAFSTTDTGSSIVVNGGCFLENPPNCTQATMIDWTTGQPFCNPFIPPGFPQNLSPSTVSFIAVDSNCVSGFNEPDLFSGLKVYPNPSSQYLELEYPKMDVDFMVEIQDSKGRTLLISKNQKRINLGSFPPGLYLLIISQGSKSLSKKIIKN